MTKFKNFKSYLLLTASLLLGYAVTAQVKVGNNPTSINANAILEMESTNKGMLLPRVALTSTSATAPLAGHVAGMTVYNTATSGDVTPGFYYNNGTVWVRVGNAITPSNTTSGQLITVTNGAGATFTAMTVAVDTTALKTFVTNAVVSGGVTGKNTTAGSLISITNGTGASFTAMAVAVDTTALKTFITNNASSGGITGQNLTAGSLLQTTGTPTGASLKAAGYQVDTTALKTFLAGKVSSTVSAPFTGNGTASSPLGITQNTTTAGQLTTVTGGTNATFTAMTVGVDTTALKSFISTRNLGADNWGTQTAAVSAPLTGNGSAGSPLSVTRATATAGTLTTVTNGTNAAFTALQYNVDTTALKTFMSSTAAAGALSGQNLTAGTLLQTTGTPTGASLKAAGYQVDTTALKTFMNGKVQNSVSAPLTGNGTTSSPLAIGQNGATTGQIMTWNGTSWVPQNAPSGADNWGTQTAAVSAPLTGNGTAGSPLSVTRATATAGTLTTVTNGTNAAFTALQYNVDTTALKTFLNNAGYDNTTDRFVENAGNTVVSTGNVGIGNTSPSHNLHVTGNTRITTKPTALVTDSVVMRFTDGELRQMSISRILGQSDIDGDGIVDFNDPDIDGDGIANASDTCKLQYGCTPSGCMRSCNVNVVPAWTAATATAITSTGTCALVSSTSIRCVFSHTGADQTLTTPPGATLASVKLWGAGGGGGGNSSEGAGGGFISGNINSLATTYTVIVGQGGINGGTTTTYGGGGAGGGNVGSGRIAGSGGGRSAIRTGSTELVTAGAGGGGSGFQFAFTSFANGEGSGGVGGGSTGGTAPFGGISGCNVSGNGGTQSAGGAIPPNGVCSNVTAGSQFTGGIGGNCGDLGGGGGAGWYGGSGGTSNTCSGGTTDAGGGGGSSGASSAVTVMSNTAGFQKTAANNTDADYAAGIGVGGNTSANGGNGRVVIVFSR